MRPFPVGTRRVDRSTYDETKTSVASTQELRTYECDPNGFISGIYLLVEATTVGNAAAVTYSPDGPFNVLDTISFNDTNNKPIIGPFTGFDLYIVNKYGGYAFIDDAKLSPVFSMISGVGAGVGGSFSFVLRLPIEIVRREALGPLPNKSSSATFDVAMRMSATATIYGVAPTAAPSVRVRLQQFGYMDPNPTDMEGNAVQPNPPAVETTQFWGKQTYSISSGAMSQRLQGIDSLVRNLVFILRDATNLRSGGDADWPDPMTMQYETSTPIQRIRAIWRHMITELYGYTGAMDAANGRDAGIYPETFCADFFGKPGWETRLTYLPVSAATNLQLQGNIGGAGVHKLEILVNKIVPARGQPMALTGR
jgi:hypothetical protein